LLNMGIEPFLITASVNLVLAQRLARKNCVDCKAPVKVDPKHLNAVNSGTGCEIDQVLLPMLESIRGAVPANADAAPKLRRSHEN